MEAEKPQPIEIDPAKAQELFNNLKQIYESGTNEQKRTLFKTYIRWMELDPELNQIFIALYPVYVEEKVKRGAKLSTLHFRWCREGDLNPHGFHHTPLKRARLPVPPPRQVSCFQLGL